MKKLLNKKVILSIVTITIVIFFAYILNGKKAVSEIQYREIKIQSGDLKRTISTTGTVTPKNRLQLKPPVAGRVEELSVQEGDLVKRDQIIGWISSSERVALIDAARASGQEELKRWQKIYKAIPLIAAIDGTLISRDVEPGQTVTIQDVIVVIADKLIVTATVDETDVSQVSPGKKVLITLDAYPDKEIEGLVERVAYEAKTSENVTVYEVDVLPNEVPDYMKSGMTVEVIFTVEQKTQVPIVPISAIQYDEKGTYLLSKDSESKTQKVRVQTGIQEGSRVEIIKGVDSNQMILIPDVSLDKKQEESKSNPFMPSRPSRKSNKEKAQ